MRVGACSRTVLEIKAHAGIAGVRGAISRVVCRISSLQHLNTVDVCGDGVAGNRRFYGVTVMHCRLGTGEHGETPERAVPADDLDIIVAGNGAEVNLIPGGATPCALARTGRGGQPAS